MSANLPHKTPAINQWLTDATGQLAAADIPSSRLDAEIILAHTLRKSRTYLHAHDDEPLTPRHVEIADARLALRLDRTPIAYIIGHKEFYGRMFKVTPATLIPRPESETIIELLKEILPDSDALLPHAKRRLVDVGTGSGCLGITAKLEFPELEATLIDISRHALRVAEFNAVHLGATVTITHGNLLANYPLPVDIVVANLPYVSPEWERSPETNYEPSLALFAENNGLSLIYKLIEQAKNSMTPAGYMFLEADPRQHDAIISAAKHHGFRKVEVRGFIICLQKS